APASLLPCSEETTSSSKKNERTFEAGCERVEVSLTVILISDTHPVAVASVLRVDHISASAFAAVEWQLHRLRSAARQWWNRSSKLPCRVTDRDPLSPSSLLHSASHQTGRPCRDVHP